MLGWRSTSRTTPPPTHRNAFLLQLNRIRLEMLLKTGTTRISNPIGPRTRGHDANRPRCGRKEKGYDPGGFVRGGVVSAYQTEVWRWLAVRSWQADWVRRGFQRTRETCSRSPRAAWWHGTTAYRRQRTRHWRTFRRRPPCSSPPRSLVAAHYRPTMAAPRRGSRSRERSPSLAGSVEQSEVL